MTPLMVAAGLTQVQGPRANRGEVSQYSTNWGPEDSAEAVEFLIAHGADVNATNPSGQTALHGAAYMGADAVVRLLVRDGAKLNVQDAQGQTPYRLAESHLKSRDRASPNGRRPPPSFARSAPTRHSASTAARCCGRTSGPSRGSVLGARNLIEKVRPKGAPPPSPEPRTPSPEIHGSASATSSAGISLQATASTMYCLPPAM